MRFEVANIRTWEPNCVQVLILLH